MGSCTDTDIDPQCLMTSSATNILSFCLLTRTALLEANKRAKEIINFLEFLLVFVSLLHRLMNHQ